VNLDLPFEAPESAELDAHLDRIDRELDALFLADVQVALATAALRAEPAAEAAA
jgi:hypothetical protein